MIGRIGLLLMAGTTSAALQARSQEATYVARSVIASGDVGGIVTFAGNVPAPTEKRGRVAQRHW